MKMGISMQPALRLEQKQTLRPNVDSTVEFQQTMSLLRRLFGEIQFFLEQEYLKEEDEVELFLIELTDLSLIHI